ncbi:hypothetical protein COBT_002998 [Conglomerata obtusa]
MHYIIFAILQFIETQNVFMYYVPQRPLHAHKNRKNGINGIILLRPLHIANIEKYNALHRAHLNKNPLRRPYHTTKPMYVQRNRPDQVNSKTNQNQQTKISPVKHTYNEQVPSQKNEPVLLGTLENYGGSVKFDKPNNIIESDRIDGSQNEKTQFADTKHEIESEESNETGEAIIVNDCKFYAFYLKNKYLIFFEIALLTILTILLVVRFEIYLLPVKLCRKCFGKRRNARVQYEPMQPEVEEYSKNNQEIDENLNVQ